MAAGTISGKVRGPRDKALADARVYFTAGPEPLPDIAALTDESGSFTLTVPRAGKYEIQVAADGFVTQSVPFEGKPGKTVNLEITMKTEKRRST